MQTYFGVDVDSIEDPVRRNALRTMIRTYGQTPKMLFSAPHPAPNIRINAAREKSVKNLANGSIQKVCISENIVSQIHKYTAIHFSVCIRGLFHLIENILHWSDTKPECNAALPDLLSHIPRLVTLAPEVSIVCTLIYETYLPPHQMPSLLGNRTI